MELTHIEFYYKPDTAKAEIEIMRERIKNIHFYQVADPESFREAMRTNLLTLENNKYFKRFNLFAN